MEPPRLGTSSPRNSFVSVSGPEEEKLTRKRSSSGEIARGDPLKELKVEERTNAVSTEALEQQRGETLTPTQPILSCEESGQIQDPLAELFEEFYYPRHECKLLKSDEQFFEKSAWELQYCKEHMEDQEDNDTFANVSKHNIPGVQLLPPFVRTTSSNHPMCAFSQVENIKQPKDGRPKRGLEDRYIQFSVPVNVEGKMLSADCFALFDGHGGALCADFMCANLINTMVKVMNVLNKEGKAYTLANALRITFVLLDSMFKRCVEIVSPLEKPGTTFCLALIVDGKLFLGNCGDSRAVLNDGQLQNGTMQLSYDFKANDDRAKKTTRKRSGNIFFSSGAMRVQGNLAVTRALGNEHLRDKRTGLKPISCSPKIVYLDLRNVVKDTLNASLALCTDGAFDNASSRQVGDFCCRLLSGGEGVSAVARAVVLAARSALSTDDLTVCLISLGPYIIQEMRI